MLERELDSIPELLARCHLTWKRLNEQRYTPLKINLKQFYLLLLLSDQELSPSEVADRLFCDKPTATVIINNLTRYGWIAKEGCPKDRRRAILRLTVEGRKKMKEVNAHSELIQFSGGLSQEEEETLRALLQKSLVYLRACSEEKEQERGAFP